MKSFKKYVFRKYSKKYPYLFNKEKRMLINLLGNIRVEHVGSTSIPGLGGKGIIDILIGVNKNKIKTIENSLLKNNYILMQGASNKERRSFKKNYGFLFWKRRVHIHLTWLNSKTWKEMLKFKKALINSKSLQEKYSNLKKKAVKIAQGEGKIYRKLKEDFIKKYSK